MNQSNILLLLTLLIFGTFETATSQVNFSYYDEIYADSRSRFPMTAEVSAEVDRYSDGYYDGFEDGMYESRIRRFNRSYPFAFNNFWDYNRHWDNYFYASHFYPTGWFMSFGFTPSRWNNNVFFGFHFNAFFTPYYAWNWGCPGAFGHQVWNNHAYYTNNHYYGNQLTARNNQGRGGIYTPYQDQQLVGDINRPSIRGNGRIALSNSSSENVSGFIPNSSGRAGVQNNDNLVNRSAVNNGVVSQNSSARQQFDGVERAGAERQRSLNALSSYERSQNTSVLATGLRSSEAQNTRNSGVIRPNYSQSNPPRTHRYRPNTVNGVQSERQIAGEGKVISGTISGLADGITQRRGNTPANRNQQSYSRTNSSRNAVRGNTSGYSQRSSAVRSGSSSRNSYGSQRANSTRQSGRSSYSSSRSSSRGSGGVRGNTSSRPSSRGSFSRSSSPSRSIGGSRGGAISRGGRR